MLCRFLLLSSLLIMLTACSNHKNWSLPVVTECSPIGALHPVCGLRAPEDMALMLDKQHMLVSSYGGLFGGRPGNIVLLDLSTDRFKSLYPYNDGISKFSEEPTWGDVNCKSGEFSPHGLDLTRREDGRLQLLVVNHGPRETIEMFEVVETGPALVWRGCVVLPQGSLLNDVAALPGGGFVVTHMVERDDLLNYGLLFRMKMKLGFKLGYVWQWTPEKGLSIMPGSQGAGLNGIAVSANGRFIYVNDFSSNSVRKIERLTGRLVAQVSIEHPDNSSWNDNGKLLVASLPVPLWKTVRCHEVEHGGCANPVEIFELDPDSMEKRLIFQHEGAPMGVGTVAVQVGKQLYIGSAVGDRLMIAPWGYGI